MSSFPDSYRTYGEIRSASARRVADYAAAAAVWRERRLRSTTTKLIGMKRHEFADAHRRSVGYLLHADVLSALTDLGQSWFGIAVAAGYAYLGVEP